MTADPLGHTLDRRSLLRLGGIGVVGAAAALVLPSCGSGGTTAATTTTVHPTTTAEPLDAAAWSQLAGSLHGHLVRPGDPTYLVDLQLYDPRYDGMRPAGIAYCASPSDVQRCLDFARRHALPFAARAGGHSYGGYSTTTGLIIDVTSMQAVTLGDGTATVGAGARLIDVYSALNAHGVSIAAGSCPTVGIAGLTLGGGQGVVGRLHGLTCDQLSSVDLVTPDSHLRTVSKANDPDLFWACQGGGGGNFGIATAFTFRTFPVGDVTTIYLRFPWAAAPDLLPAWLAWAPHAPDELWANCLLGSNPGASAPLAQVAGVFVGSSGSASSLVQRLIGAVGASPIEQSVNPTSFAHAMYLEGGCAQLTQAECHLPTQTSQGRLQRLAGMAKSQYVTQPMSASTVATLLNGVAERHGAPGATSSAVNIDAYGGAINRVDAADTAFVHRDALACIQYTASIDVGQSASTSQASQQWLDQIYDSVHADLAPQAYQNYVDPTMSDWAAEYYGANLGRLQSVKKAVDPDDAFHFAQSIPLP